MSDMYAVDGGYGGYRVGTPEGPTPKPLPAVWLVVNPDRGGLFGCYLDEHEHLAHNAACAIGGLVARCPIVADYRTAATD